MHLLAMSVRIISVNVLYDVLFSLQEYLISSWLNTQLIKATYFITLYSLLDLILLALHLRLTALGSCGIFRYVTLCPGFYQSELGCSRNWHLIELWQDFKCAWLTWTLRGTIKAWRWKWGEIHFCTLFLCWDWGKFRNLLDSTGILSLCNYIAI